MRGKIALEFVLGKNLRRDLRFTGQPVISASVDDHLIHLEKTAGGSNGGRGFRQRDGCEQQHGDEQAAEH